VAFRSTLLNAFADVANALGARANYAEQARRLRNAFATARNVEKLTEAQYKAAAITLRTWLDSQDRCRSAEAALADVRLAHLVNESTLYRALGVSTSVVDDKAAPAP